MAKVSSLSRMGALADDRVGLAVAGREEAMAFLVEALGLAGDAGEVDLPQSTENVALCLDILALRGHVSAQAIHARLPQMAMRAAARVRASLPAPATLRRAAQAGDVVVDETQRPYTAFFAVEEILLRHRKFDASLSPVLRRAAFVSGDAVTVLPFDPVRGRVLLVEQFRAGPLARGDANPWQLEAIAGRIDAGETPEAAARREAQEEAGLTLGALIPVASYYPSPGIVAEYLYSYVAICDLPDSAAGIYGVADEAEDIRSHIIAFDDLMALVSSGEVGNAPLILTALWLAQRRASLTPPMMPQG